MAEEAWARAINTCPRGTKLPPLAFLLSNSPNQCPVKLTHRVNKLICPSPGAEIGGVGVARETTRTRV